MRALFVAFALLGVEQCSGREMSLAAQRILQTSDCVLGFALDLVGLAFGLSFLVAEELARDFLHFAFGLLGPGAPGATAPGPNSTAPTPNR